MLKVFSDAPRKYPPLVTDILQVLCRLPGHVPAFPWFFACPDDAWIFASRQAQACASWRRPCVRLLRIAGLSGFPRAREWRQRVPMGSCIMHTRS